ncbi:MAG: hypothetical protein ABIA04_11285 [Pseudomonadota bacterium]
MKRLLVILIIILMFLFSSLFAKNITKYKALSDLLNHDFIEDSDNYNLTSIKGFDIIFFDFNNCLTKVKMFERAYHYLETNNGLVTEDFLMSKTNKNACGYIDGHDYSVAKLVNFFNAVLHAGEFDFFVEEKMLIDELMSLKLVHETYFDDKIIGYGINLNKDNIAIISTDQVLRKKLENDRPEESLSWRVWRRVTQVSHESKHGFFFSNEEYYKAVDSFWKAYKISNPVVAEWFEKRFLAAFYPVDTDYELLINEFQAYVLNIGRDGVFWAEEFARRGWINQESFEKRGWTDPDFQIYLGTISQYRDYIRTDLKRQFVEEVLLPVFGDHVSACLIDEDGIRRLYAKYNVPTRVVFQAILIGFKDALIGETNTRTYEDAHTFILEVLDRAYSGEDFGFLTNNFSDYQNRDYIALSNFDITPESRNDIIRMSYLDGNVAYSAEVIDGLSDFVFSLTKPGEIGILDYKQKGNITNPQGFWLVKRVE